MTTSKVSRSGVLWFVQSTLGLDPSNVASINITADSIEVELFDSLAPNDCDIHTYKQRLAYENPVNLPWRYDAQEHDNRY